MASNKDSIDRVMYDLKERAKELKCLYLIQEILNKPTLLMDEVFENIIGVIPQGWQYPAICQVKINYLDKTYLSPDFEETPWVQKAEVTVQEENIGEISVYYKTEKPDCDEGPFFKEERKLINTIAELLGSFILQQQLRQVFQERQKQEERKSEWWVILDFIKRTNPKLMTQITRKMINYLGLNRVKEVDLLLERLSPVNRGKESNLNRPAQQNTNSNILAISDEVFTLASQYLPQSVILENIQTWIKEDRSSFMVNVLVNPGSSLGEISTALERYQHGSDQVVEISKAREKLFKIALIRHILSEQKFFIEATKPYVEISDFSVFMHHVIHPLGSHGKLGGKGSGLFLAAQVIKKMPREESFIKDIKIPKTWYLTSDSILYFMSYNNLEDIIEQKFKDIEQIRQEYPFVIHVFKNSPLPPEMIKGLSTALDDFGSVPLIVRSSSLLEDQRGAAFAGKYKSLFIANQGSKEERLNALIDAITEVFASMFGPDPIEYRFEHGLIDNHEEMGILIQEVVGSKVGHYYLPAFAGVAFSHNEFRWSSRIKLEDGLVRIVPGLGTRAVDRLSDDYSVLAAPGSPKLRVNVTMDEMIRYSPKKIDVINLKTRTFESIEIQALLKQYGNEYPLIRQIVSLISQDYIRQASTLGVNFEKDAYVVTFEGLFSQTPFLKQIKTILDMLQEAMNYPVDLEFAHDGKNLYLLQCRPQSHTEDKTPATIPANIQHDKIIFSANRFVMNGVLDNISHIVYVDPQKYSELSNYPDLNAIGQVIGRLNQILPKRQFILMGPGRWGSRGEIKLGVGVTYSDINNTAMLIEIARKKKDYLPEPSFGTHFFQDLVEASIFYLPLYPDDTNVVFNESFLMSSENMLSEILPEFARLSHVIRVIDIAAAAHGQVLQVLMNADTEKAVAFLGKYNFDAIRELSKQEPPIEEDTINIHWRWRLQAAENIAAQLDAKRFGVKGFYVFGSTKNATAGPKSDIDLLIHFQGTDEQRKDLLTWLEGWSLSLSHVNFTKTGYKSQGLLDLHIVTDEDIANRTSFASKIGAITDAARPLVMGLALIMP